MRISWRTRSCTERSISTRSTWKPAPIRRLRPFANGLSFGVNDDRSSTSNAASVAVETATGTTHELVQEQPPGTHENPLTDDERREKFVRCGTKTLGERAAREAFRTLDGLPGVDDVAEITADLRPTEPR